MYNIITITTIIIFLFYFLDHENNERLALVKA